MKTLILLEGKSISGDRGKGLGVDTKGTRSVSRLLAKAREYGNAASNCSVEERQRK